MDHFPWISIARSISRGVGIYLSYAILATGHKSRFVYIYAKAVPRTSSQGIEDAAHSMSQTVAFYVRNQSTTKKSPTKSPKPGPSRLTEHTQLSRSEYHPIMYKCLSVLLESHHHLLRWTPMKLHLHLHLLGLSLRLPLLVLLLVLLLLVLHFLVMSFWVWTW